MSKGTRNSAPNSPLASVLERLDHPAPSAHGYVACCPAHEDRNPSLSIDETADGVVLIHCHAGCTCKEILASLGLRDADLFPTAAMYPYTDEQGNLFYQVIRYPNKRFRVRSLDETGRWRGNITGVRRVLYRLPEVLAAIERGEAVYLTEGEKDADNLVALGAVATTNPFGAGNWRGEYTEMLRNARVVILPDNDDPGRRHAQRVADSLEGIAAEVRIVELPGLASSGDVSDWLGAGGTAKALEQLAESCMVHSSGDAVSRTREISSHSSQEAGWPTLSSAALYGVAGDFVRLIAPQSEADPAALLVHFLVGVSILIGRHSYFQVEASRHYLNLSAALVGRTSKGRKGTAEAHIRNLLRRVDAKWARDLVVSGLSSGEGLIHHVRDPQYKEEPVRRRGSVIRYQRVRVDEGVKDKRLLVIEPELAGALRAMKRKDCTLSPTLRAAWDSGDLRTLTKTSPLRATGAHIGVLGHITRDELKSELRQIDLVNGLANRFLFVCVSRAGFLPEGGDVPEDALERFAISLRAVVDRARSGGA